MMFEELEVQRLYVSYSPVLALMASGRGSGIVLDIGDGVTTVFPVYESKNWLSGVPSLFMRPLSMLDMYK